MPREVRINITGAVFRTKHSRLSSRLSLFGFPVSSVLIQKFSNLSKFLPVSPTNFFMLIMASVIMNVLTMLVFKISSSVLVLFGRFR